MTIADKIRDENVKYYIIRETTKISALLLGKVDKH